MVPKIQHFMLIGSGESDSAVPTHLSRPAEQCSMNNNCFGTDNVHNSPCRLLGTHYSGCT